MHKYLVGATIATALAVAGCGGNSGNQEAAPQTKALRMGGATVALLPSAGELTVVTEQAYSGTAFISNAWGGHQARVTVHQDGVRLLYISSRADANNPLQWNLMKQDPTSKQWSVEATGISSDDVNLVRDKNSDLATVVAYPSSVPTTYTGPAYAGVAIAPAGQWPVVLPKNRQYGAVGISPGDGTLCVKVSNQRSLTSDTDTIFSCAKYVAGNWVWSGKQTKYIGNRQAYDYLFPGAFSDGGPLLGVAQSDLERKAAGYPNSGAPYVFNGFRQYSTAVNDASTLTGYDLQAPYQVLPGHQASDAYLVPQARVIDSFVNSKGLVLSTYSGIPGDANFGADPVLGFYLVVSDKDGKVLQSTRWPTLQTYGNIRIFEDDQHRMWLLWTGQGPSVSNMKLYRLQENSSGPLYTLGADTNLGAVFKSGSTSYSITGAPLLALPRGGQMIGKEVVASIAACENTYDKISPIADKCYTSGENSQKILSFRIHLPD